MGDSRSTAVLWGLTGLHVCLLVLAAIAYPVFRAPDEAAHLDMTVAMAQGEPWPAVMERMVSERVRAGYAEVRWDPADDRPLPAAGALTQSDRSAFAILGPDEDSTITNQMPQHPPLYYVTVGAVARLMGADDPEGATLGGLVVALRLATAAFLFPLPALAFRAARTLGLHDRNALVAAAVTVGIPQLTHIGGAVNNDALLILAGSVLTVVLVGVMRGRLGWWRAVAAGLTLGGGLLTKGFALALCAWVLGAYLVAGARTGRWVTALSQGAAAGVIAFAVGGWWWLNNVRVYGTVQPTGAPYTPASPGFSPELGWWAWLYTTCFAERWWFEPNIVPTGGWIVVAALSVVMVALIVVALWRLRSADAWWCVLAIGTLQAVMLYGAWSYYTFTGDPFGIHGRYVYPAIVPAALLTAAGLSAVLRRLAHLSALLAIGAVTAVQTLAASWWLRTYWAGDDLPSRLAAMAAWAPWPERVTWAVVTVTVILAAITAAATVRLGYRRGRGGTGVPQRSGSMTVER